MADKSSRVVGAHLQFLCLGKGVKPDLADKLLAKCFTGAAQHEADETKFIQGKVCTARQESFQADLNAMENGWLDISKGMSRLKRVEYERNKKEASSTNADGTNITSALTPNNPGAYNFAEKIM